MTAEIWTRELIRRRRALHTRLDLLAGRDAEAAARLRLALHTLRSDVEAGRADAPRLEQELSTLERAAGAATALLAA